MTEANDDRADVSLAANAGSIVAALSPQLAARSLASLSHSDQSTQLPIPTIISQFCLSVLLSQSSLHPVHFPVL